MFDTKKKTKKPKRKTLIWLSIFLIFFAITGIFLYSFLYNDIIAPYIKITTTLDTAKFTNIQNTKEYQIAVKADSTEDYITISNQFVEYDQEAGNSYGLRYTGQRVNIAISGLDSRIGTKSNHADANHILSILVDSGKIEIISVPRDTPADAGLPDSTGQNKLTVVRAVRGREAYLEELAKIAKIDKIHYFIEVGFSQVIGILDFFGFRDAKSTLQILRSRKGLGGDDYQRCYNQAQFIKQMILHNFKEITSGFLLDLLLRGGLALVSTNLTYSQAKKIISLLVKNNFPKSEEDITIKIRPPIDLKFRKFNLLSEDELENLKRRIELFNKEHNQEQTFKTDVYEILNSTLKEIEPDTIRAPKRVISKLITYYEQRAWLQISDEVKRGEIRQRFENCLTSAFKKLNYQQKAQEIHNFFQLEHQLFKNRKNKR